MMRILPLGDGTDRYRLGCVACSFPGRLNFSAEDFPALPLSVLIEGSWHVCKVIGMPLRGGQPRGKARHFNAEAVTRLRNFLAETTTLDATAHVALHDLYRRFREGLPRTEKLASAGPKMDYERFADYLRVALPPGTDVRRSMIAGVRARRVHGLRLLDG